MSAQQNRSNAIRALTMDAVEKAKSGHPGAPMGMADIAEVLWTQFLRHNPQNPDWQNRDRFVLSNGHGSMLIYALLHLTGYDLSIEELKNFRQLGSKTPGHPEYGYTPGVETTTGPLGQGLANAVGMALAEKMLSAHFNRSIDGQALNIVDHDTYVFAGDGCLMEGISHEVASLAGTLGLGKLICVYDDNGISIDGSVEGWFADDTPKRFEAYGWQVIPAVDGHDHSAVAAALAAARANPDQPTLICCKTEIGYGAPNKAGTAGSHGAPLGTEEIAGAREKLGWSHEPFDIPADVYDGFDCKDKGADAEAHWQQIFAEYQKHFPELAAEFDRRMSAELPNGFDQSMKVLLDEVYEKAESMASRQASAKVIAELAKLMPELTGGSADLSGSNLTSWPDMKAVTSDDADGNYIYYGVREFGMTAMANGMALHGGLLPFTGTFLIFMEYARNAVRMSALMGIRNIHVYTHDSIGQGEDGPTHQAIEQLTSLRTTPNMSVWRPCDTVETVVAWQAAIERKTAPTSLIFSRQSLPYIERDKALLEQVGKGAYILRDSTDAPEVIILATGSEVALAIEAFEILQNENIAVRVVSMPSADTFALQSSEYQESVLPGACRKRLAVETSHGDYWRKWVGLDGDVLGMSGFGESGPGRDVLEHFGFTAENIVKRVKEMGR